MLALLAAAAIAAEPPARFSDFVYSGLAPVHAAQPLGPGQYRNPILEGFYPDPSITRVGPDFYLVNSTFAWFPGLPIFKSRDLVTWTQIGAAIDRPGQFEFKDAKGEGLGVSRAIFAPDLSYHDGTFYLVGTCVDCGGNFVITAARAEGPWSNPTWLGFDGIDPSLFFDDDGKAYLVNNGPPEGAPLYDGHRAIWVQQFDPKALRLVGPRTVLVNGGVDIRQHPSWIEGPHLFKHAGRYFLIAAEGGTGDQHSEVVFRAEAPTGPFAPFPGNPILTQRGLDPHRPNPITSAGHAEFVTTPAQGGKDGAWWAVFLATRPYRDGFYNTGRETFLAKVSWQGDGWPMVIPPGQGVAYVAAQPGLPPASTSPQPTSGDFTVRASFKGPDLPRDWMMLRTPHARWWKVGDGVLSLTPRSDPLGGHGQPAFLARRQQHPNAEVSVTLAEAPKHDRARAGLVAFQNESHFYFVGLKRVDGRVELQVEARAGGADPMEGRVLASTPMPGTGPVRLKIVERGDRIDFAYAPPEGAWRTLLKDADATVLSTKAAGGFVGAVFGVYAYAP